MSRASESYVSSDLFEIGMGHVLVCRYKVAHRVEVGAFLVDIWCRGVKSADFFTEEADVFRQQVLGRYFQDDPPERHSGSYGRKLVEAAQAYARSLGMPVSLEYKKGARVFGGIDASECAETFSFGREGKPCFMIGPYDDEFTVELILRELRKRCGEEGYHWIQVDEALAEDLAGLEDLETPPVFFAEDSSQAGEKPDDVLVDFAEEYLAEHPKFTGIEFGAAAPDNFASEFLEGALASGRNAEESLDFDQFSMIVSMSVLIWNLRQVPPLAREAALAEVPEDLREVAISALASIGEEDDRRGSILDWRLMERIDPVTKVPGPRLLMLTGLPLPIFDLGDDHVE